jgi:hypothetical protein
VSKRRFRRTMGTLQYNQEHGFFYGYLDGKKVTMNRHIDEKQQEKWFVSEEIDVFEVEPKADAQDQGRTRR